jgi:hypothetical protein
MSNKQKRGALGKNMKKPRTPLVQGRNQKNLGLTHLLLSPLALSSVATPSAQTHHQDHISAEHTLDQTPESPRYYPPNCPRPRSTVPAKLYPWYGYTPMRATSHAVTTAQNAAYTQTATTDAW